MRAATACEEMASQHRRKRAERGAKSPQPRRLGIGRDPARGQESDHIEPGKRIEEEEMSSETRLTRGTAVSCVQMIERVGEQSHR